MIDLIGEWLKEQNCISQSDKLSTHGLRDGLLMNIKVIYMHYHNSY